MVETCVDKKHRENDPDGTIQPRRRGRPKTMNDPDQTIKPKTKHVKNNTKPRKRTNDITRKELLSQAKEYNLIGYTKWNKQQLITFLDKAKELLFKKDDLLKLTKEELINVAKENNIKVNLRRKRAEIIDAVLKT